VGYAGHVVDSGSSRPLNVDMIFFKLRWDRYRFNKNHVRTCSAKLVFSHLLGYAGHVVHSGVSDS
jgi:hypothetical protein